MKKILSILRASVVVVAAMVAIVSFNSCREMASSAIEDAVTEANRDCPFDMGNGLICDRIYTSGNSVVYSYLVDDQSVILGIEILGDSAKDYIAEELKSIMQYDESLKTLIDLCVEAEYDIVYKYSDYNGDSASVTVPHSDLALF